jgi:hypothetical protein
VGKHPLLTGSALALVLLLAGWQLIGFGFGG